MPGAVKDSTYYFKKIWQVIVPCEAYGSYITSIAMYLMDEEKQRMLSGKPYKSFEPVLVEERQKAKELIYDFNLLRPGEIEQRNAIIKSLFGKTGDKFFIEPPFRCDYGYNIFIGENFYSNYNLVILDCAPVTIGSNVLIAPNVAIYTAGHPLHPEPRSKEYEYAFPITIENNVWIGGNVVINPGVKIGHNSVIGAGSVVTKDIPPNVVGVGNPCRILKEIVDAEKQFYFKKLSWI